MIPHSGLLWWVSPFLVQTAHPVLAPSLIQFGPHASSDFGLTPHPAWLPAPSIPAPPLIPFLTPGATVSGPVSELIPAPGVVSLVPGSDQICALNLPDCGAGFCHTSVAYALLNLESISAILRWVALQGGAILAQAKYLVL